MSSGPFPGSAEDKGSRIYPRGRLPQRPVLHPEGFGSSMAKLLIPLLAPLILMLFIVPTGYLLEGPGPSFDLQEDLTVTGAKTYPSQGELMLTAVSLQESRLAYHLVAFFSDSFDLLKVRDYLGEELDTEEQDVVDIVITFLSQDTAVVAGLRELGMPVEVRMMGELVVGVAPGYPASGAIDKDGAYQLSTFTSGDGVIRGEYLVVINTMTSGPTPEDPNLPEVWAAPKKYGDPIQSPLKASVPKDAPGPLELNFDLEK